MNRQTCSGEIYTIITEAGFGFPLPATLKPAYWLAALEPNVHRFPMSSRQTRTDDYGRAAGGLMLEGDFMGQTETQMHEGAGFIRGFVIQAAWLQRANRASLELLPGSDIELKPNGESSRKATLGILVAAEDQEWIAPDGRRVTG